MFTIGTRIWESVRTGVVEKLKVDKISLQSSRELASLMVAESLGDEQSEVSRQRLGVEETTGVSGNAVHP